MQSPAAELAQHGSLQTFLDSLTDEECAALLYDWRGFWARPNQIAPADREWLTWLILAGRGFGKTRTGAEWVRDYAQAQPGSRIALVAPTAADARDTMVEGESGIMAICPPWNMPKYEPSKRRLTWPDGTLATLFSAEEPERLRGPQHHAAWCDEMCAWDNVQDTWDMLAFGLRLGMRPQVCITTTPKPFALLKEIMAQATTRTTRGSTRDNAANLAPAFMDKIIKRYEGTRLGRQELEAEILDDNPGAIFQFDDIKTNRVDVNQAIELMGQCDDIVVGVDPNASDTEDSDECGIVVAGRIGDEGYVFSDRSTKGKPSVWAKAVVNAYDQWKANTVVPEVNNGGDMVVHTIHTIDKSVKVLAVRATRGKQTRAEPIAALYEQGRIHHVGVFPELERQMTEYNPTVDKKSPDRMDALVWAMSKLFNDVSAEPRLRSL